MSICVFIAITQHATENRAAINTPFLLPQLIQFNFAAFIRKCWPTKNSDCFLVLLQTVLHVWNPRGIDYNIRHDNGEKGWGQMVRSPNVLIQQQT
jgi:hypothetical protein